MLATGSYLPGDPITNDELEGFAGGLPEDVLEGLQVKTRHWIADPRTGDQAETNSEMAGKAAKQALESPAETVSSVNAFESVML